jgi:hypothetical protein
MVRAGKMAERGNEKMTEWLDIKLDTLSPEERIHLILTFPMLNLSEHLCAFPACTP